MSDNVNGQPISLEHQAVLSERLKMLCLNTGLQFAEYSFANMYLFRRQHAYAFIDGEYPLIRGKFNRGGDYYIPVGRFDDYLKRGTSGPLTFFPIPEAWLLDADPSHHEANFSRDDSDYLYCVQKLKTLSGGSLSSRRNLLYQFEARHNVESRPLTQDVIPDALKVLERWQQDSQQPKEKTDYYSCCDAFDNLRVLGLAGRVVYADGEPAGFIVGELLTPSTALFHLSKSIHHYKGVTPFLYQDFAKSLPDTVEWINLEQDLGLSSLRRAKEAYDPDILLPKYRVNVL